MARKKLFVLFLTTVCFVLVIAGKLKAQEVTPVDLIGHLQTLVIDEIDNSTGGLKCRFVHYLKAEDGRLYQIKDTKGILGKIKPSARVNISGSIVDSEIVVEAATLLSTEKDVLTAETTPETIGEQKTIIALFNYPDKLNKPFTIQDIQNKIIYNTDSTNNFIKENSYDKTWINADFIDWQTLPNNSTYYNGSMLLLNDSIATLDSLVNFQNYARLIFIYVDSDAFLLCGRGSIGKWGLNSSGDGDFTASVSWIGEGCAGSYVIAHELGHNLGFWHASAVECTEGQYHVPEILWYPTSSCGTDTFKEYGDANDTMGQHYEHFSTIWKSQAKWIDSSQIQEAVNSEYTIDQVELPSSGTKILKIPLGKDISGNDFYYWVEYRKNLGTFETFGDKKDIVQIRAKPTSVYTGSTWSYNSLRFRKGTLWGDEVDIDTDKSFHDPYRGVKIELIEKTGSGSDSKAKLKVVMAPQVTTGSTTNMTLSSVTLNGTVNAFGEAAMAWFEYGTTSGSYSNTTSTQTVSGSAYTTVSIDISGLSENTTYYYRIVAQNSMGTVYGSEGTFIITQPETVSTPSTPSGPTSGVVGTSYTYSTGGATSNLDHSVEYRFNWGDGTYSSWSSSTTASKTWSSPGTYVVKAQARCATHTDKVSGESSGLLVNITQSEIVQLTVNASPVTGNISTAGEGDWYQFTVLSSDSLHD